MARFGWPGDVMGTAASLIRTRRRAVTSSRSRGRVRAPRSSLVSVSKRGAASGDGQRLPRFEQGLQAGDDERNAASEFLLGPRPHPIGRDGQAARAVPGRLDLPGLADSALRLELRIPARAEG